MTLPLADERKRTEPVGDVFVLQHGGRARVGVGMDPEHNRHARPDQIPHGTADPAVVDDDTSVEMEFVDLVRVDLPEIEMLDAIDHAQRGAVVDEPNLMTRRRQMAREITQRGLTAAERRVVGRADVKVPRDRVKERQAHNDLRC